MDTLTLALRVVLSLAAVLGLLWYAQRRLNRPRGQSRAGDPLTVVARRGLGQKSSLVIVDTDGKRLLLGVTERSINVLQSSDAPPAETTVPDESPAEGFARAMDDTAGMVPPGGFPRLPGTTPLAGSVFDAGTWKQAAAALRKGLFG